MMDPRGKLTMKREEAGSPLMELGEELLRTGRLTYPPEFGEARDISTPESLVVEVEYKEKKDKKKFEIEFEWYGT